MNLNQIAGAVEYCIRHEFFQASSVFTSKIESIDSRVTTLCLIYKDNTAQIKFNPTGKCDYNFRVFSLQDLFAMFLRRDQEIVSIFSQSILLLDKAKIASHLYSSLIPIKIYNQYFMSEEIFKFKSKRGCSKSLSMLFCDIGDSGNFIIKTFIPLCNMLKNQLKNCRLCITWKSGCYISGKAAKVTIFSDNNFEEDDIVSLQKYLYGNVSELQLARIYIPYKEHNVFWEKMPLNIYDKTNDILCDLTDELLLKFTNSTLNENEIITNVIYYYIVAAKAFFLSRTEFNTANKCILDTFLEDSISSFTKSILDHQILSNARDKILREFKRQSDKIRADLLGNYIELLDGWDKVSNLDAFSISLQVLSDIRNEFNKMEKKDEEYATKYFIEFCRLMFQCWDIPSYYRAYVPFCIKYIASYEI